VLSAKVKKIFSDVISHEQFGFLTDQQIYEAIGAAQLGLHTIKTKNCQAVVLKLDLSKAYDRTNWPYVRLMLLHIGFSYPVGFNGKWVVFLRFPLLC
jgi:hypothetical protein